MRRIGRYEVATLVTEQFALDGGAMFGAVPRVLWERLIKPDAAHRIPLCSRILILRGPEGMAIVDCGNGDKWSEKQRAIFDIQPCTPAPIRTLIPALSTVILTHLHFDHAGGVSFNNEHGEVALSFPSATHFLQTANWEHANSPGPRERSSYLADIVGPLANAQLTLVEDGAEMLPGVTGHRSDGHTRGLQWILIRDTHETIAYPSDLIPTAHHISIPYVMGYDLWPERTMEEKSAFLRRASAENWLVIFEHDRETVGGRVRAEGGEKFTFTPEDLSDLRFSP